MPHVSIYVPWTSVRTQACVQILPQPLPHPLARGSVWRHQLPEQTCPFPLASQSNPEASIPGRVVGKKWGQVLRADLPHRAFPGSEVGFLPPWLWRQELRPSDGSTVTQQVHGRPGL